MASDKDIKAFCRNSITFSIPLIQLEFSVTYKEAARIVDELVGAGMASLLPDGLNYKYNELLKQKAVRGRKVVTTPDDSASDGVEAAYVEFLKRRASEMAEEKGSGKANDDDDTKEDDGEDAMKKLRVDGLRKCIDHGYASVFVVLATLPVNYTQANAIMEWMQNMKYISKTPSNSGTYKLLITKEQFRKLYGW